ncbi:hypothetical protein SeLEV6574_g02141 [Synchytrium endobioticum]|uniref:G-protein coupled receptors family 1 profile domain-containing protein n=1 Tax=Synchytrium endobioticum TaxID=286115 RepID=A0A507C261_9FUNG|nr:hypothetical protein SeLEV6574_g08340 [Synchytrium endobioticum]TPX48260.1 hypothetical protein SeLEV6574_g02141 [Synchytrium endobioticum]
MGLHAVSITVSTGLVTALLSDFGAFRKQSRNLFYLNVVVAEGLFAWSQFIKSGLILLWNELLQNRALQYADAFIIFATVVVMVWTLTNVALDRWLIICKGIQLSDRAIVAGCVGGWLFGALVAMPLYHGGMGVRLLQRRGHRHLLLPDQKVHSDHKGQQMLRRDHPTPSPPVPQAQMDAEFDMCRKFIMLTLASIMCGTPMVAWILSELLTGRRAPEPFVALATMFVVLEPTVDCVLIIHTNPRIQARILGWLRRGWPASVEGSIV